MRKIVNKIKIKMKKAILKKKKKIKMI